MTFKKPVINFDLESKNKFLSLLFICSLVLIFFTRLLIYLKYNLNHIDTDQAYVWAGALDYAQGHFYEPRFYGQDYNTFMEGLFAVPLIWLNVPIYLAVPLATHFIALFPYLFMAFYLFIKQKKVHAFLVLVLVIGMPIENDLLNAIPRGFVTGLFFTSFFILSVLNPNNLKFFALNGSLAVIGYFVNPNSILVSAPFACYLFLHHIKNPQFYIMCLVPLLLIYPLFLIFNQFYIDHPSYVMHPLEYQFSFQKYFFDNIQNLDQRFCHICLFTVNNCIILLSVFLLLFIGTFVQNFKAFVALIIFLIVLFISFCFGKTAEGSTWVFGSYARMYLGLPILIALIVSLLNFRLNAITCSLMLVPLLYSGIKIVNMDKNLEWHLINRGGVITIKYQDIVKIVTFYKQACLNTKTNFLLVSSQFWGSTMLSCGGKCMDKDFPECSETYNEKRYWVREKNKNRILKEFVFLSANYKFEELIPKTNQFEFVKLDLFGLYYIKNNTIEMDKFIEMANKVDFAN